MIDLSVFGIDTQTAVAIFLTVYLSELVKKIVDDYNLKFEKTLFRHWNIFMPLFVSLITALIINIKYLTFTGYLESWAYIFAFSIVLYETIVRRIKSHKKKSDNETQTQNNHPYTPSAQERPIPPCDIIYPSDGGK